MGVILVVVAALMGFRHYHRLGCEREVRAKVVPMVQELPGYAEKGEVIDGMFEKAHEVAFKITYAMGGRLTGEEFDQTKYEAVVFGVIHQLAERGGRVDIEDAVETLVEARGIRPTEVANLDEAL
ncbi:MAG: hypothetical protein P8J87_19520 [Verrucomicrobiales bacterium]|nr:hypothetical protein [Verrucomicrobiales bacterium]